MARFRHRPNFFCKIGKLGHIRKDHCILGQRSLQSPTDWQDAWAFQIHLPLPSSTLRLDLLRAPNRLRFMPLQL